MKTQPLTPASPAEIEANCDFYGGHSFADGEQKCKHCDAPKPLTYHAVEWENKDWTKTWCGLDTFEAGASTTNRDRVTCADCLALLKPEAVPVIAPEPIAYVTHQPKSSPVKALRKKTGDLGSALKPQSGFEFGSAANA